MAAIRAYTTIEQSRKLAEILPLESADMFYDGVQDLYKEKTYNIPMNGSSITVRTGHIITEKGIKANLLLPAWSLTALLDVLPKGTRLLKSATDDIYYHCDCPKGNIDEWFDNPIDACYEMIIHLHELELDLLRS